MNNSAMKPATPEMDAQKTETQGKLPPNDRAATVSVIILNYNGREDLAVCLESLEKLEFPGDRLEILVIDNGSTDGSAEMVASQFPKVRLAVNKENLGFSLAANQGAALANGAFLAFLNNDMRVDKSWLSALLDSIGGNTNIVCAGSKVMNWNGNAVQFNGRSDDLFSLGLISSEPSGHFVSAQGDPFIPFASGGAMLFRAEAFRQLGGFDPDYFMYHEDVDLGLRLWIHGHKCVLSPRSVVFHKGGASSGKLPKASIDAIQVKNMLLTMLKDMELGSLKEILPPLFYFLIERTRYWLPARESLEHALEDFRSALGSALEKRNEVQKGRVLSDAELFSQHGHPFDFLLSREKYRAAGEQIRGSHPMELVEPPDVYAMETTLTGWMTAAHFAYERDTFGELVQKEGELREHGAGLREQAARLLDLQDTLRSQAMYTQSLEQALKVRTDQVTEILNSRSWKAVLLMRRIRIMLVPPGGLRAKSARGAWNALRLIFSGAGRLLQGVRESKLFVTLRKGRAALTLRRVAGRVATMYPGPLPESPAVSIIIPVYNQLALTLNCLLALVSSQPRNSYEVIVIDDASTDRTQGLLSKIKGIKYLRNSINLGFLESCNEAAERAQGQYLVFLNNDTRVHTGWLDQLVGTFSQVPGAGIVGSKLIFPTGKLQEAGGVLWADGSAKNYGCREDPQHPIYNYLREVDYVSGASLMLPRHLWKSLGGFDRQYRPAYYEDADLAFRVRQAGYKVIYQPFSEVTHFEGSSSGVDVTQGTKRYQVVNHEKFFNTWYEQLAGLGLPSETPAHVERDHYSKARVLFIDDVPLRTDRNAGAVLSECYLSALRADGYAVTFLSHFDSRYADQYTRALQRKGIECVYRPYLSSSRDYIRQEGGRFDYVVVSRASVAIELLDVIKSHAPQAKVIFNTIDLHFMRLERGARLSGDPAEKEKAEKFRELELDIVKRADCTLVVSEVEAQLLSQILPRAMVRVVPFPAEVHEPDRSRDEVRSDIVYLGGFQHTPNIDAVLYFAGEIWPLLKEQVPQARFVIAGPDAPQNIQDLAGERILVKGYVEDLGELFSTCKVTVAPIRYGAGIKGKVLTSLGYGVPCVASSIAAEGIGLSHGQNILLADTPGEFAEAVVRLYRSPETWNALSSSGIEFIRKNYSRAVISSRLLEIFDELAGVPARASQG